jgi:arylsulfatase A-like enzyme
MRIVALALLLFAAQEKPARPNILWLIAEDLGPEIGCYGGTQVWTPNLDKLAKDGVRYTRAYTTAPVCSPSRSAFMTGMYQTTIGAHNHRSHREDSFGLPDGVRVITDWLRPAGYFTANVVRLPAALAFKGTGKTDWNFHYGGKAVEGAQKMVLDFARASAFDGDAWDDLKTRQPFYAQINFQETHRPYRAPKRADPSKVEFPPYYPDHPVTRADWAAYLDSATELDRKVGLVLKQLEDDGLGENTVIIFIGDHGQSHVRGKQFCYESGLHIPLLIRWPSKFPAPKGYAAGSVDARLLESIDLSATTLAIAGVAKPPKMQGRVFLGDRAEPARELVFGARDRCDETVDRIRSARDARYRYIRNFMPERPLLQRNRYKERSYPVWNLLKQLDAEGKLTPVQAALTAPRRPEEELYDLESDPFEIKNLAGSAEHAEILKRLRGELDRWIESTNDQGRTAEPAALIEELERKAKESDEKQKK